MLGVIADHSWDARDGVDARWDAGGRGQQPMTQTDTITIITTVIAIIGAAAALGARSRAREGDRAPILVA
jgi:hypothetical protein